MLFLARMLVGLMLAATGQIAVMNTLLLAGVDWFLVFLVGVAAFVIITHLTIWRKL